MQELEKILEEMQAVKDIMLSPENKDCFGEPCKENDCCACAVNKCMEIVSKHMNDGWVPVEERLPEDSESDFYDAVIVTMANGSVTHGCYRNHDKEWWVASKDGAFRYAFSEEVIAWRPLPDPYRPERSVHA